MTAFHPSGLRLQVARWIRVWVGILLLGFMGLDVGAGFVPPQPEFPAIPAAVWAERNGEHGLVMLEQRLRFSRESIETYYRIRITSEVGREALGFEDLPTKTTYLRGRTVHPDGSEVAFQAYKDFAVRKMARGSDTLERVHLVPPGLTADCVVEVQWAEAANGPMDCLPARFEKGTFHRWVFSGAFPIRKVHIEIPLAYPMTWNLYPGLQGKVETRESATHHVIEVSEIPAFVLPPFAVRGTYPVPTLVIHGLPPVAAMAALKGPSFFWRYFLEGWVKPQYEAGVRKGKGFATLQRELLAELSGPPASRASELLRRLDARVINLGMATLAERERLPKRFWEDFDAKDFEKVAESGITSGPGMRVLYFHLLREAGIQPKVLLVKDRNQRLFDWNRMEYVQFDHELIGVESKPGTLVCFDPTLRHAEPEVLLPNFTGVPALIADGGTWVPLRGSVPGMNGDRNTQDFTWVLNLGADGDEFTLEGSFGGYPGFAERRRFMALDVETQRKVLQEGLERAGPDLKVHHPEIRNVQESDHPLTWRVEGRIDRESDRIRKVWPFPGLQPPLELPARVEEERRLPIVLPYPTTFQARSTFALPSGWDLERQGQLVKENGFGRVVWNLTRDPETAKVTVRMRVEITTGFAAPSRWKEFREFLGWVQDACTRQVRLAPGP